MNTNRSPRTSRRSRRARLVAGALACSLGLFVAACGAGTVDEAESSATNEAPSTEVSTTPPSTTPPTTAATIGASAAGASSPTGDAAEFCAIFQGLSTQREQRGDGFERYPDEASWEAGVVAVQRIADVAPAEIATQAETYVQLVIERKGLAASYGYGEVPADVKLSFGRAHASMQQQANQLIAYAKANCEGVT